ncbi:kinase-like domain-containing protein [Stachybotrys elegans]|uniref:non-specific serine/threonine protein kinase n=1 Tax=Stachybotrys elegans TaxID=80388 RepID=A0A8K0SG81_9HYPO|nr:kinase-like domain-containing protein [Stachybotrys elegans]
MMFLSLRNLRGRAWPRKPHAFISPCPTRPSRVSLRRPYSSQPERMPDMDIKYGMVEDVESPYYYCPGGYHPVNITDCLAGRYHIVHKLGHGTFSTVWLAHDSNTSRYVAVKVGTADAEKTEVDALLHIQRGISASSRDSEKLSLISTALDHFTIQGPNGTHPCIVTTPARCGLRDTKQETNFGLFQLEVGRSLAAQLALAVSLVHSQGYAHGDLHLGNVLLEHPYPLDNLSVSQLYATIGEPEPEHITREDGKPIPLGSVPPHLVLPCWHFGIPCEKLGLAEAKLSLSDFGVAFRPSDKSRFESFTPWVLRSPEAYFEPTTPLSFGSDIWSLGCIIFECIAVRSLINGDWFASQDRITAQQIYLQGPPPFEWQDKFEKRDKWFDEAWNPSREEYVYSWDKRFEVSVQDPRREEGMEPLDAEEMAALQQLLRWMLAWRPEDRPTAEQVLKTKWMRRWALPAYEKSRT